MAGGGPSGQAIEAHDGSDWSFRMTVEERYKSMVKTRKTIKITATAQLVYILLRSAWKFLPAIPAIAGK